MDDMQDARITRQRDQLRTLVTALGLEPRDIPHDTPIDWDGTRLHLTRYVRDDQGKVIVHNDEALQQRVSIRVIATYVFGAEGDS